ncbi:MAG: anhydro-N-acetylmuramic acid kinase [Marivibrio sp.]|uniref:anhydro-N-acetylmuramic acid kinase n=1 Tax=Marivibrio sp. TaxID=2039719 RepID=UPI0032EDA501
MAMRRAIGLMSGTSMDGVDAAFVETDGEGSVHAGPGLSAPYPAALRRDLQALLGAREASAASEAAAAAVTEAHIAAVEALLARIGRAAEAIDVVGFHGQTIFHQPPQAGRPGWTWQLGDGQAMADRLGIPVVFDFRSADMAAGGQGAPLAPVYHRALAAAIDAFPAAFLNVGGVSNLTFLADVDSPPIGFDTGPGNAPIDDLVHRRTGAGFDENGRLARAGRVDERALAAMLEHPYFGAPYPKSLDRNAFDVGSVEALSTEDAAATLVAFAAEAVARGAALLPDRPRAWYVTGGGRRNPAIMAALEARLGAPAALVEAIGTDGDLLEAQAFGYMAVRRLRDLPISFPETTGCAAPTVGGRLAAPSAPRNSW